ncbi:hypothetical protein DPMN_177437 [Dreissena polymorpha]|uniref:Uncharacterized protein n=1 Tax=Dreissena polymorpha TaxID=45954 RepID=A0A9D4EA86_DREPO|nr:hypothetical protein DPMN_177437 [Dreissena polymorpha]
MHCDGTKRMLNCNNGYVPKDRTNVTSVCVQGQWTNITRYRNACSIRGQRKKGCWGNVSVGCTWLFPVEVGRRGLDAYLALNVFLTLRSAAETALSGFLRASCLLSCLCQVIESAEYTNIRFGPRQDESIKRVMIPNLSFKKCLKQYVLRSLCEVMGYFRAALLCELHFISDFWDTLARNENGPRVMVYVQRSEISLKDVETCESCFDNTETCGNCVADVISMCYGYP